MDGTWVRAPSPARRFGDEWLGLHLATSRILVVRGAPALAAIELLTQPRDVRRLLGEIERAASTTTAQHVAEVLESMRACEHLTTTNEAAIDVVLPHRFLVEPISFFTEALSTLFGGLSAASIVRGGGVTLGHDQPCGR